MTRVAADPGLVGSDVAAAADALRTARGVTAICHENPDADTIGAAVAVARIARAIGIPAEVVSADGVPPSYDFLGELEIASAPRLEPDLAVVCDAATVDRVGTIVVERADWFARARILNVDHHVTNSRFGAVNLVDPSASATCEVVYGLVPTLGVRLDAAIATPLLAGIVRDSQGFADPSTSPRTMRVVAELIEAGASLADIHRRILGELPFTTIALWARVLMTAEASADGRIVAATLRPSMLAETGTEQHDADGVVEFLAAAQGSEVVVLLRELGPDETRASIRTRRVDAAGIAATFGGGGHALRAGCTLHLPVDIAVERVVEAAASALASADG